jgi:hypothetical protein
MEFNMDEIEIFFFRFLAGELPIKEFEQWLYSTPQVEGYLGESAYFEFISFNFRQPTANYELSKLIYKYINAAQFYTWQIKQLLKSLLDGTQDPVSVFENLYDMYCKGYQFLGDIGIQYVLGIDEIPKLNEQHLWNKNEFFHRRKALDNYLLPMKDEVEILLQALESGEIKILSEQKYSIEPEFSQKLQSMRQALKHEHERASVQPKKNWWRFW